MVWTARKNIRETIRNVSKNIKPLSCRLKISHRHFSNSLSPPKICTTIFLTRRICRHGHANFFQWIVSSSSRDTWRDKQRSPSRRPCHSCAQASSEAICCLGSYVAILRLLSTVTCQDPQNHPSSTLQTLASRISGSRVFWLLFLPTDS